MPPLLIAIPHGDLHGDLTFDDYPPLFDGPASPRVAPTDTTGDGVAELHLIVEDPMVALTLVGPLAPDGGYTVDDAQGVTTSTNRLNLFVAGDLDGDGLADLALSSSSEPGSAGEEVGFVGILPGTPTPAHTELRGLPITVEGDTPFSHAGAMVLGPGDLDGDGADDLVIGIPGDTHDAQELVGEVRVFLGPLSGELALDDAALRLSSGRAFSSFGSSIAAGDLDGDGRPDLAIGAPFNGPTQAGAVYVWTAAQLFP